MIIHTLTSLNSQQPCIFDCHAIIELYKKLTTLDEYACPMVQIRCSNESKT